MLDKCISCSEHSLSVEKKFADAPAYLALEVMAQAGALHFRKCMDFSRHAFLLSVQECPLPEQERISGTVIVKVTQTAMTDSTAAYDISLEGGNFSLKGTFLFGSAAFGAQFSKESLTTHYKELFRCLQNG